MSEVAKSCCDLIYIYCCAGASRSGLSTCYGLSKHHVHVDIMWNYRSYCQVNEMSNLNCYIEPVTCKRSEGHTMSWQFWGRKTRPNRLRAAHGAQQVDIDGPIWVEIKTGSIAPPSGRSLAGNRIFNLRVRVPVLADSCSSKKLQNDVKYFGWGRYDVYSTVDQYHIGINVITEQFWPSEWNGWSYIWRTLFTHFRFFILKWCQSHTFIQNTWSGFDMTYLG